MTAFIGSQEKKLKDGRNGNIRHQNGTNGVMSNGVSPNSKFAKGEQVRLVWDVNAFVISNFLLDFRSSCYDDFIVFLHQLYVNHAKCAIW